MSDGFAALSAVRSGTFRLRRAASNGEDESRASSFSRPATPSLSPTQQELKLTVHDKSTSDRIAHLAAIVLKRANVSEPEKQLAGSALAQHHTSKQTSAQIGKLAAHVLADRHACAEAKELAGSVLAQVGQHERTSLQR
jgi:hypothetical protein